MKTILERGIVAANEDDLFVYPDSNIQRRKPVVYCHGSESADFGGAYDWMKIPTRWRLVRELCRKSSMISSDLGGNQTWGNSTSISRAGAAYNVVQTIQGVSQGKVIVFGQSMGALTALNWARLNKDKVCAIVLLIPVINLNDIATNSIYSSTVNNAYGGYSDALYGATNNPLVCSRNGDFNGIPILLMYGVNDTLCKKEFSIEFSENCDMCTAIPLEGGHTEIIQNLINIDTVSFFMDTYGAA